MKLRLLDVRSRPSRAARAQPHTPPKSNRRLCDSWGVGELYAFENRVRAPAEQKYTVNFGYSQASRTWR